MRSILHIGKFYPPHMGGMEVHVRDLVRQQARTCSVSILVASDGVRKVHEHRDGAELFRLSSLGSISSMQICPTLPWHVFRSQADIIHMHMPNPAAAFAYLASGCRIPLVITHHSDTTGRANLRRLSDPFVQKVMHRASRIIVTSRHYANTSIELRPHMAKIEVVPLGIDPSRFEKPEREAVRKIQSKYGPHLVVAIGRLVPFKGFEFLIRAMQHVLGNLLLIGDGPLRGHLEGVVKECNLAGRVFFTGPIDNAQIANYLSAAEVFALPSICRAESFGIVQLEAMAAGLPVVNTNIDSGVSGVSLDGITGITVPPADSFSLAHALTSLLEDGELRSKMGQAGKARVRSEFSIQRMSMRTMEIYESILSDHEAPM